MLKKRNTPSGARGGCQRRERYENSDSWTPPAGTPPEPTETPRDAAQAEATDQPTNQEQPSRPHNHEAKRGQAAETRSDGRSPGDTGTRETHNANQPKTRDHPNARTTAAAEGNGARTEEHGTTTKQRYEKQGHPKNSPTTKKAAPTPKKAAPKPKKNTPKREKAAPRNAQTSAPPAKTTPPRGGAGGGAGGTRPTSTPPTEAKEGGRGHSERAKATKTPPKGAHRKHPPYKKNSETATTKTEREDENRHSGSRWHAARWAGRFVEVVQGKSEPTFRRESALVAWLTRDEKDKGTLLRRLCDGAPDRGMTTRAPGWFKYFFCSFRMTLSEWLVFLRLSAKGRKTSILCR